MRLYIIEMSDNSIRIMTLISGIVEKEYAKWIDGDQVISAVEIGINDIPNDRYFRNGWKLNSNNKIGFDLIKCKEIQLAKIRAVRDVRLQGLDGKMFKAIDQSNDVKRAELATKRQRLRDITEPLKNLAPKTLREIIDAFPLEFLS